MCTHATGGSWSEAAVRQNPSSFPPAQPVHKISQDRGSAGSLEEGLQSLPCFLFMVTSSKTTCKVFALCMHTGYRWQLVRSSDRATSQQPPTRSTSAQDITALSDRGSDGSLEGGPSLHSRPHLGTAGEVERLRSALRQKEDQVASLQSQLTNLEATRDRSAS